MLVDLINTSLVRWPLVSEFWREAVLGFLILLSVAVDTVMMRHLLAWRRRRALAAQTPSTPPRNPAAEERP